MKAVFLGDSITMGYGLENKKDRYTTVFCDMAGAQELNFGTTGTLVARAGPSADDGSSFVDRFETMESADLAVVFGGTNDYFWSDMPIEGGDCRYFEGAVRRLCEGLKEKYPGVPTVFITPYKMRGIGNFLGGETARKSGRHDTDARNFVGRTLEDYVFVLLKICGENGVPVLDLYNDFGADIAHSDSDEAEFTLDGCHPNEKGHKMIANALYAFCKENKMI